MAWRACLPPFARSALLIGIVAAGWLVPVASMAEECALKASLVVSDLGAGVVGPTGTVWTVSADCGFAVARQVGLNPAPPHKRGQLTADQRRKLAVLLTAVEGAALPSRLGAAPQPNAPQITVAYGKTRCVLTLPPPGRARDASAPVDAREARIRNLAQGLRDMLGE